MSIIIGTHETTLKGLLREEKVGTRRTSRDHSNYSIIEIGQHTETSPEDLRRLASHSDSSERPSAKTREKNS